MSVIHEAATVNRQTDAIASDGVRHAPTLVEKGPPTQARRVTPARVARIVEKMMVDSLGQLIYTRLVKGQTGPAK